MHITAGGFDPGTVGGGAGRGNSQLGGSRLSRICCVTIIIFINTAKIWITSHSRGGCKRGGTTG